MRHEQDWDASRLQTTRLAGETASSIDQLRGEESQGGAELAAEQRTYDEVIQSVEQRRKSLARAQAQVLQLETEVRQLFSRFNPLQFELDEKRKTVEASGQATDAPEPETAAEQVNVVREQAAALEKTLEERRGQSEGASRDLTMLEQEQAALAADSKDRALTAESYRKSLKNAAAFVASLEQQIRNGSTARRVLDVVDLGEHGPLLLQLLREELATLLSDDPCDALALAVRRYGQATIGVRYAPEDDAADRKDVATSSVAAMAGSLAGAPPLIDELLRRLFVASSLEQGLVFAREHCHDFYKVYCEDGFVIDSAFAVRLLRGSIEHSFAGKDSAELSRLEAEAVEALRIAANQAQAVALARHKRSALLSGIQQAERDLKQAQERLQAMVVEEERRLAVEHERASRLDVARSRIVELEKELAPLRETLAERRSTLAKARDAQDGADKARQKAEAGLLAGKDKVQVLQIRRNSVSGRVQALLEKKLAYEEQLASLATEIRASQDGLVRVRAERVALEQRISLLDTQFREKSNGLAAFQAGIDQLELDKRHKDEQSAILAAEMEGVKASRTRLEGRVR